MSLSPQKITEIAGLNQPDLCVDTCILLDIVRDITRESYHQGNARAALKLIDAAEPGKRLVVLVAELVEKELGDNLANVVEAGENALSKFIKQAKRMHEVAEAFGAAGTLQVAHLEGHGDRARVVLDRWTQAAVQVPGNSGVLERAMSRVMAGRTPSRRGKESPKDCIVVEAYLEAAGQLRAAGLTQPIVFASSNTQEFFPNNAGFPSDIADDFNAVDLQYEPNLGAAMHRLGLK